MDCPDDLVTADNILTESGFSTPLGHLSTGDEFL